MTSLWHHYFRGDSLILRFTDASKDHLISHSTSIDHVSLLLLYKDILFCLECLCLCSMLERVDIIKEMQMKCITDL